MRELRIKKVTPEGLIVEASAGCTILNACREAVYIARLNKAKIIFNFNDVTIEAEAHSDAQHLAEQYMQYCNNRAKEWDSSEEGKQAAEAENQQLVEFQKKLDGMLAQLDKHLINQAQLIAWLGDFSVVNDHNGTNFDKAALAAKLEAAGYLENEYVGEPPEEFHKNKVKAARYIVGQALRFLNKNTPIHPVCASFAKQYAEL